MKTHNKFLLAMAALFLFHCVLFASDSTNVSSKSSFASLTQLVGYWQREAKSGTLGEHWIQKDSVTLNGFGYKIIATDTTITEKMTMLATDSGNFFIADVPGNPEPVWFRLISSDSGAFIFENKAHDFPTRVCYQFVTPDSIAAYIEGTVGDKIRRIEYPYGRVKSAKGRP